jgi:hypothetical protein
VTRALALAQTGADGPACHTLRVSQPNPFSCARPEISEIEERTVSEMDPTKPKTLIAVVQVGFLQECGQKFAGSHPNLQLGDACDGRF